MRRQPWVQEVPRALWAYVAVQVLMVLVAAVPGDALTIDLSRGRLSGAACGLLVMYFLLRGHQWAWYVSVGLEALAILVSFVMVSATLTAVPLELLSVVGLWLLLRPESRDHVRQPHTPRLTG
jgi:hypothetical protein